MIKLLLVLLWPVVSSAVELSAGVGLDYPVGWSVDGKIAFADQHVYTRFRAGKFIPTFTSSMNSVAQSMEFYNSATGEIISESLRDGTHVELAVGYQQDSTTGWVCDLAYTRISGAGQVSGSVIAEAVSGITLPGGGNLYEITGLLDNLTFRVGYQWEIQPQLVLTVSGGVMKPLSSVTTLDREVSGPLQRAILDAANAELDEYMNTTYKNDVILPLLGATLMYMF